jgi:hypothetical protein
MPPFLITPTGCEDFLVGEEGLDLDWASKDLSPFDDFLVGEDASETLLSPDIIEGVRGVFVSERERTRFDGVFGGGMRRQSHITRDLTFNCTWQTREFTSDTRDLIGQVW